MIKKHNRKFGILGVSLTKARINRKSLCAMGEVQNEIEEIITESGYLNSAPFEWITLAIRYGIKHDDAPRYQRINKRYGDLPLAIEVDTHEMLEANCDVLKRIFMVATLKALIHAGHKYGLPTEALEAKQKELGSAN